MPSVPTSQPKTATTFTNGRSPARSLPQETGGPSHQEIGDGEHDGGRDQADKDPGEDVEGKMHTEVDAGEDDEQRGQHERGGERRIEDGERKRAGGSRGGVARGEGARRGGPDERSYLRVPEKRAGAVEQVL